MALSQICSFAGENGSVKHYISTVVPRYVRIQTVLDTHPRVLLYRNRDDMNVPVTLRYLRYIFRIRRRNSVFLVDEQYPRERIAYGRLLVPGKTYRMCRRPKARKSAVFPKGRELLPPRRYVQPRE